MLLNMELGKFYTQVKLHICSIQHVMICEIISLHYISSITPNAPYLSTCLHLGTYLVEYKSNYGFQ